MADQCLLVIDSCRLDNNAIGIVTPAVAKVCSFKCLVAWTQRVWTLYERHFLNN